MAKAAVLLQDAARYREPEDAYLTTIDLKKSESPATMADVVDHMGTMYVETGQLSKAEAMERQALAIRENEHDPLGAGVSHMHLAMLLLGADACLPLKPRLRVPCGCLFPNTLLPPPFLRRLIDRLVSQLLHTKLTEFEKTQRDHLEQKLTLRCQMN